VKTKRKIRRGKKIKGWERMKATCNCPPNTQRGPPLFKIMQAAKRGKLSLGAGKTKGKGGVLSGWGGHENQVKPMD